METTPAPLSGKLSTGRYPAWRAQAQETPIPTIIASASSPSSPPPTELSFLNADASSTAAAQVKVRIPLDRVQNWKAIFANGSNAQIVYSSEADVFLIIPTPNASNASSPASGDNLVPHPAPSTTASTMSTPETSTASPLTTAIIVAVVVVVFAAVLCAVVRKRLLKRGEPGLLSSILASTRRKASASPSILEDRWSEWSTSSHNILNANESPKRVTTHSNLLLSAQATPKRVPVVIYENEQ